MKASRTAAVLLAAGRSLRHPQPQKLYRPVQGRPLGLHAARTLAELSSAAMVAVCSSATRELEPDLTALGFETVWNEDPARGLASSVAIGVRAAQRHRVDAILICLADMPFVTAAHLRALVATLGSAASIKSVGSRVVGTTAIMPPAVFAGDMSEQLLALEGDRGAGAMLARGAAIDAPAWTLADLDDPEAFEALDRQSDATGDVDTAPT